MCLKLRLMSDTSSNVGAALVCLVENVLLVSHLGIPPSLSERLPHLSGGRSRSIMCSSLSSSLSLSCIFPKLAVPLSSGWSRPDI